MAAISRAFHPKGAIATAPPNHCRRPASGVGERSTAARSCYLAIEQWYNSKSGHADVAQTDEQIPACGLEGGGAGGGVRTCWSAGHNNGEQLEMSGGRATRFRAGSCKHRPAGRQAGRARPAHGP